MRLKLFGTIILATCIAGILWVVVEKKDTITPRIEGESSATESTYVTPPFTDTYTNDVYRFSVGLPEGFKAQEFEEGEGHTILLQDQSGNGIQILIIASEDHKTLTVDDIRASIPDMQVSGEQPVEIGAEYTGVAFKSDNEAFGGDSREVWFFFHGNLYQISTYARLDPLLQSMFATWKFY